MEKLHVIILAGVICILMAAAGCTGTSGTSRVTITTPAAATAVATPAAPAAVATVATVATPGAPSASPSSWSGTWNTTYGSPDNKGLTVAVLNLTQDGSAVTGTYDNGIGLVNATEQGGRLTGTWSESYKDGKYAGLFAFVRSADD